MSTIETHSTTFVPPRRVVAGIGPNGRSCVVSDAPVEGAIEMPTMAIANVWSGTLSARADNSAPLETAFGPFRMEQLAEPAYAMMIADYAPGLGSEDPGMHFTDTTDHFYVIEGEVVLVLEDGEAVLGAGDVGVVRGVVHGWRNDSDRTARVVTFVLPATRATA